MDFFPVSFPNLKSHIHAEKDNVKFSCLKIHSTFEFDIIKKKYKGDKNYGKCIKKHH